MRRRGSRPRRSLSREHAEKRSIRFLRRAPDDVEVGILDLRFLHHARAGCERRLAGFVAGLLVCGGDLLAARYAVGDGEAGVDILRAGGRNVEGQGEAKKGEPARVSSKHCRLQEVAATLAQIYGETVALSQEAGMGRLHGLPG